MTSRTKRQRQAQERQERRLDELEGKPKAAKKRRAADVPRETDAAAALPADPVGDPIAEQHWDDRLWTPHGGERRWPWG